MQGYLQEIDIRSILQLIEVGQRTGELLVESYEEPLIFAAVNGTRSRSPRAWFIFFLNGRIVYATDQEGGLVRLQDHLKRHGIDGSLASPLQSATLHTPEYACLWDLLDRRQLTPEQARSIVKTMVQETLFDLLSLHQGAFRFEQGSALTPQLTTIEVGSSLAHLTRQLQIWKQFYPLIQSPDQSPIVIAEDVLKQQLPGDIFSVLHHWMQGTLSLRRIARYLNRDIPTVGQALYPYVQAGLLQLNHPIVDRPNLQPPIRSIPVIACIDDSATVRQVVSDTLQEQNYQLIALADPIAAIATLFEIKPDLILCDIAMPEMDGYELCAMLRQSTVFHRTPIVMLTGKDGFTDRIRAKMVGATDYLTKPFTGEELLMLVETYIGAASPPSLGSLEQNDTLPQKSGNDSLEAQSLSTF